MKKRIAVIAMAAVVAVQIPVAAQAAGGTPLPFGGFGDMVVDATTSRVFVSSGTAGSSIAVLDLSGKIVKTITGVPGASGMVVDGSTLYVLEANGSAVDVFDTTSLTKTSSFEVPFPSSGELTMAGGRLWFGTGQCEKWGGKLTSLDPATGTVASYANKSLGFYCATVASSPTNPNVVLAWDLGLSPTTVYKFDISMAEPPVTSARLDASGVRDIAFSSDGTLFYFAAGSPYEIVAHRVEDFAKVRSYPAGSHPLAVELSPDGAELAAGVGTYDGPDVYVFPMTESVSSRTFDFGTDRPTLYDGALAFSPDSQKIFAVTGADTDDATFQVLSGTVKETSLSLTVSDTTVDYNHSVTVTAHLGSPGGVAGMPVSIYMTPRGQFRELVKSGTVNSSGDFRVAVKMNQKATFTAEFAGDVAHAASSSSGKTVNIRAKVEIDMLDERGKSGKYHLYRVGDEPTVLGIIRPAYEGAPLTFVAQVWVGTKWTTFDKATMFSTPEGMGGATLVGGGAAGAKVRARITFPGSKDLLGASSPWIYFKYTS